MHHRLLAVSLLTATLFVSVVSGVANAQQYPPPTPTATAEVEVCIGIEGEVGNEFVAGQAEEQGEVHVFGSEGAAGDERDVDIFAEPGHVLIGSVTPLEDGSFSGTLTLPSGLEPGTYEVATDVASCTETAALQVLSASGDGPGTDVLGSVVANDDGTDVLGAAGENTGNLPVTGSDILDLILLALVLIGIGEGVRRWAKKRRGRAAFGFLKSRPLALPAPSVPHLDTRGFAVSVAHHPHSVESPARSASSTVRSTWTSEESIPVPATPPEAIEPPAAPTPSKPAPAKSRTSPKRAPTSRSKSSSAKRKPTGRKTK